MIGQINRTRFWLAITMMPMLLSLVNACNKGNGMSGDEASQRRELPPVKVFQFETVTLDANGKVTNRRTLQAKSYTEDLGGGVQLEMVEIPTGTFTMGSPASVKEEDDGESPQHQVTVPKFYMGKFEVTQAQWRAVASLPKIDLDLNKDASHYKGDNLPAENVSWDDAVEFCKRLSKKTGHEYRLPSEAEWEYAARAGTQTPFAFGETITPDIVNYRGDYPYAGVAKGTFLGKTVAVGSLGIANGFGLYDMHGNVWEWCEDYYHENYNGAPTDGSAWMSGGNSELRVMRGGAWSAYARRCRSAFRSTGGSDVTAPNSGFRLVAFVRM